MSDLSPRQRCGTCCPFDPECEHSFMDANELATWMDTPISNERWLAEFGESSP